MYEIVADNMTGLALKDKHNTFVALLKLVEEIITETNDVQ